jgi:type I site-specific restriction endonuclease
MQVGCNPLRVGGHIRHERLDSFVNLLVDHLTEHGAMEAGMLYESPFTDLTPRGPEEIFSPVELDEFDRHD